MFLLLHGLLLLATKRTTAQKLQGGPNGSEQCRLAAFLPFTDQRIDAPGEHANEGSYGYGCWPSAEVLWKASFSLMASAEIAISHFNQRNTTIVKELGDLVDNCPITIPETSFYLDSGFSRDVVVDSFLEEEFGNVREGKDPRSQVCALIGPVETESHEGIAAVTENFHIPQVAFQSIGHRLSRSDLFPTFARVISDASDWGTTLAKAVHRDLWLREYLAIIYEPDYGDQFESPLEDAEDELDNFFTITEEVEEGSDDSIRDALGEVVSEGYRTIMYIGDRFTLLDDVARVADEMGLLGEGYFWILSGAVLNPKMLPVVRNQAGSSLDKLLDGAAMFTNYDPFVYEPENDTFLTVWKEQKPAMALSLNLKQPSSASTDETPPYFVEPDYFQTEIPTEYASFIFDAVMCVGIGACKAHGLAEKGKDSHHEQILNCSFTGASGLLNFKKDDDGNFENSRDMVNLRFGFHNIRPLPEDESGVRGYEIVLHALWSNDNKFIDSNGETENGAWRVVNDEPFYYFGGTTEEPMPLRTVANANYISKSAQTTGFFLVSLSCFLSLCSAAWVFAQRKTKLVLASQPPFLYLLCFGSILVAISLVFVSFDEDKGWSDSQLDRACSTFPWVFVLGYETIYCALLMKLWRLSQLMQLRRRVVKMHQVLAPFAVVLVATIGVLTLWQVRDPLVWEREITNFDPLETYGKCETQGNMLAYLVPLGFLIALVTTSTAIYAWKLKDVQSDLAESKSIFFAIFTHLQTWALGIPIVVITDETSREAGYMMLAALSFIFSTTMTGFVIWPKIFAWVRDEYLGGKKTKKTDIQITPRDRTRVSGVFAAPAPESSGFFKPSTDSPSASQELTVLHKKADELENNRPEQAIPEPQGPASTHQDVPQPSAASIEECFDEEG